MARHRFGGGSGDFAIVADAEDEVLKFQANATLTAWTDLTGGTQVTDLLLDNGGQGLPVTVITSGSNGEIPRFLGPDGVKQLYLDGGISPRRQFTTTEVADLLDGKLGRSEAPITHTHSIADIPELSRTIATIPVFAVFDATTNTWPATRPGVGPAMLFGDAAPPTWARSGDILIRSSGNIVQPDPGDDPEDPEDPETPPSDPDAIEMTTPTVSITGSTISLNGRILTGSSRTFRFLQFAVRTPSGSIIDCGHLVDKVVDGIYDMTGSTTAPVTGTGYRAWIAYNLTGGSNQEDWVDGPAATFNVTLPETPDDEYPFVDRSGLPWNSGVGISWNQSDTDAFGTWRNRPCDAWMAFVARASWADLHKTTSGSVPYGMKDFPGLKIISLPTQPSNLDNSSTARGDHDSKWAAFGTALKNLGLNNNLTVLRLNWEANGNWYSWNWMAPNPATFVQAIKRVVTAVRSTAPNIQISLNMNRDSTTGGKHSGIVWQRDIYDPLLGYYNYIGLDHYDHAPAQTSESLFNSIRDGASSLTPVASYCRSHGLKMGLEEWGMSHGKSGSGGYTGGGDNPAWLNWMWAWMNANVDVIGYETYYNDTGAPSELAHRIFNPSQNPNASNEYKRTDRWGKA